MVEDGAVGAYGCHGCSAERIDYHNGISLVMAQLCYLRVHNIQYVLCSPRARALHSG